MPCLILGVLFALSYGIAVLCFVLAAIALIVAIIAGAIGFGLSLIDPTKATAAVAFTVAVVAFMIAIGFIALLLIFSFICGVLYAIMRALGCSLGSFFGGTSNAIPPQSSPFPFLFPFPNFPGLPGLPGLPAPPGIDLEAFWKCLSSSRTPCGCDGGPGKGGLPRDPRELFTTIWGFVNEAREAAERERRKLDQIRKDLEEAGKNAVGEAKEKIDKAKKKVDDTLGQLEETGRGLAGQAGDAISKLF